MQIKEKMPLWGPYSKKYMGLSHIVKSLEQCGARMDFSIHPTIWNSSTPVPNVTVPSGYHLWECCADYSYYSYRCELMWKDMIYADVSFCEIRSGAYLARCNFVNNTDLTQNCILNVFSALEFPFCEYIEIVKPKGSFVKNANDYDEFKYASPRPWDRQTPDGMFRGMFRDSDFYLGEGLGDRCDNAHVHYMNYKPFGAEAGDRVSFTLCRSELSDPVVFLRYKTVGDGDAVFSINSEKTILPHSDELTFVQLEYSEKMNFVSLGGAGVEFDFLVAAQRGDTVSTVKKKYGFVPEITTEKVGRGSRVTLEYPYDGCKYYVLTHSGDTRFRTLDSGCLEDALINRLSNGDHTYDDLIRTFSDSFSRKHSDDGFFQNTLIKSIFIAPRSEHTEYVVISDKPFDAMTDEEYEKIYLCAKSKAHSSAFNKAGEKYAFSTDILCATLMTNTVYPVYLHGENVVHHTPGKRWDSFYTWDSGFIGMGLLEFSPHLCRYALEMYLCDEDNDDFCFLLHGSLVPTQFAEYLELLKRTEDKSTLDYLYPKMKRYYEFLRGRTAGSTLAKFNNGLLTAYDYWYSCSGMDDYPAQVEMIKNKAEQYSCPCITTSHAVRAAKIMRMVAEYLGKDNDVRIFNADIEQSTKALNDLAWDEESGYYGYTMYDRNPQKPYIMKTENGESWNKGLDGVYPLVAAAVPENRKQRLLSHIKNENEMWSPAGISAVDMSASYYLDDGYWNGNVWMSHQWYLWKTMLDNGETDFAFDIAKRALDMWKEETDFSYNTYECFGIKTRRGGWFHNFGGLSAPICIWANAYYKPGTITTGFDVWTDCQKSNADSAEISFKYFGESEKYSIIVALSDSKSYGVSLNSKAIEFFERESGIIEITLDGGVKSGILNIYGK